MALTATSFSGLRASSRTSVSITSGQTSTTFTPPVAPRVVIQVGLGASEHVQLSAPWHRSSTCDDRNRTFRYGLSVCPRPFRGWLERPQHCWNLGNAGTDNHRSQRKSNHPELP